MKNTIIVSAIVSAITVGAYHYYFKSQAHVKATHDVAQLAEVDCLAHNIFYEAGTESQLGKIAVAQVTVNRLRQGSWGKSICQVVYSSNQFSWTQKDYLLDPRTNPRAWLESLAVALVYIYNPTDYPPLKNSLFYHAESVHPDWAEKKNISVRVGHHIFYTRAKGSWVQL